MCVQAVATAEYKFSFVSATHAGSTQESTAFQATKLYTHIMDGKLPSWAQLVCDDAYGHGTHMLTPFSGKRLSTRQDAYNFHQSSPRIVVEKSFGILVKRWGILWSPLRFRLAKATDIIMVCLKLHNLLMNCEE